MSDLGTPFKGDHQADDRETALFRQRRPADAAYHDDEWGVSVHDDRLLFEHLILDTLQAGLSWRTILYKREAFRRAFLRVLKNAIAGIKFAICGDVGEAHTPTDSLFPFCGAAFSTLSFLGFDPERVARLGAADRTRLMADAGIVRNRMKIEAAIANARAYLRLVEHIATFDEYLWSFTGGRVLRNPPAHDWGEIPTTSREAQALSRDLQSKGFQFVGPTICCAFMQAVGMVDDHLVGCFRFVEREVRHGR